jgi:hypothetical protein
MTVFQRFELQPTGSRAMSSSAARLLDRPAGGLEFQRIEPSSNGHGEYPLGERSVCDIIKTSSPVSAQTERRRRCLAGEELYLAVSLTGRFFWEIWIL